MKSGLKNLVFLLLLLSLVLSLPVQSVSWWTVLVAFTLDTILFISDAFAWIRRTRFIRSLKDRVFPAKTKPSVQRARQYSPSLWLHQKGQYVERTRQQLSN